MVDGASDNAFDPLADQTVSVSTVDDDTPGFTVVPSGGATGVSESGTADTFTVVLNAQPNSDVVLTVSSGDPGKRRLVRPRSTFTPADWNMPQTVTVTGINDDLIDGPQTSLLTVRVLDGSSDNNFDPLPDQTVSVTTADNDAAGFVLAVTGGSTAVSEAGTTDTFTVVLTAQPDVDVVLSVLSGNTSEATAGPATLTFTPANWNLPQTVTVTGANDDLIDGPQTTAITVSVVAASSDDNFDPVPDQTVSVTTADDDTAGFTVVPSGGATAVGESGTTDTFTVVLHARPQSNVVFNLSFSDAGEGRLDRATLTFTPADWNVPQTVTLTGVDDPTLDGPQTATITLSGRRCGFGRRLRSGGGPNADGDDGR